MRKFFKKREQDNGEQESKEECSHIMVRVRKNSPHVIGDVWLETLGGADFIKMKINDSVRPTSVCSDCDAIIPPKIIKLPHHKDTCIERYKYINVRDISYFNLVNICGQGARYADDNKTPEIFWYGSIRNKSSDFSSTELVSTPLVSTPNFTVKEFDINLPIFEFFITTKEVLEKIQGLFKGQK